MRPRRRKRPKTGGSLAGTHVAIPCRVDPLKPVLSPDVLPSDPRPVQDEWGFYDPEQAGFEAVLRKLGLSTDEIDDPGQSGSDDLVGAEAQLAQDGLESRL